MLSITVVIIMGFKWKKLKFRPSLGPGSVTEEEEGGERRKTSWVSARKRMQCAAPIPTSSLSKPDVSQRSTTKLGNSNWTPRPHRHPQHTHKTNLLVLCCCHMRPVVLRQAWLWPPSSQGTAGSFERHFWSSQLGGIGYTPGIWWWKARDAAKLPAVHRTAPQQSRPASMQGG